jgi:hypothetical protein
MSSQANFHALAQVADDSSPSLTVYSVSVKIPAGATNNGVIQVTPGALTSTSTHPLFRFFLIHIRSCITRPLPVKNTRCLLL